MFNGILETGLLTIGPRFGGAVDDAARYFKDAYDRVSSVINSKDMSHFVICPLLNVCIYFGRNFHRMSLLKA